MRWKFIVLMTLFFTLGSFSGAFAADDSITLDQAKKLANENSRSYVKYQNDADKAKYQLNQSKNQLNEAERENERLISQYNDLEEQLNEELNNNDPDNPPDADEINKIQEEMSSKMDNAVQQAKSVQTLLNNKNDAEDNYDDSIKAAEKYQKQLEYQVEQQYTTILIQEENLQALNKEYAIDLNLLESEKAKMQLGSSNQANVNKMSSDAESLNKQIIDLNNLIKALKGNLNDIMGRDYDDNLTLVAFDVPEEFELPEYDALLSKATQNYDTLSVIKRTIDNNEDDLDDTDDYNQRSLIRLDIKEKELQLEDEKFNLKDSINNLISDFKIKQEDYKLSLINLEDAQNSYEWDKKRYELGQISKLDLLQSELNYLNSKNKNVSAGYAFYLAYNSIELAENGIF